MTFSNTNNYIKDNFNTIIQGDWDTKFTTTKIESLLHTSFILNHLTNHNGSWTFKYDKITINITAYNDPYDGIYMGENEIINSIRNENEYQKCITPLLREWKINKIINIQTKSE